MIRFQICSFEHLHQLLAVETEVFSQESFALSRRNFLYHLKQEHITGIFIDDELAGYILLLPYKNTLKIYSLAVLKQFQNRHIGSALIEYCIRLSEQKHFSKITLEVRASNAKAIAFYEKHGFKTVKHLTDYYPEESGYKMVLEHPTHSK